MGFGEPVAPPAELWLDCGRLSGADCLPDTDDRDIVTGDDTKDESCETPRALEPSEVLALLIAWSRDEPWRVGAVAFLPASSDGSTSVVLGRGPALADDPHPRLSFGYQRPGSIEDCGPLASPSLSRVQLRIRVVNTDSFEVENLGRSPLFHNGQVARRAEVAPGDVLQLGRKLLLFSVRLAERLPSAGPAYQTNAFGEPDAYGIVGESFAAWSLRQRLAYVAARPGHVLFRGASGTGKELAAHAVHALSSCAGRPLIARNAATIPDGIADAELFGNAKNYPNAGMSQRLGLVGEADRSTLFLDEFAELSASVQARLLRVLDEGEYQPLGEARARRSKFRLIAATNRPESALRHDLLARFRFKIEMPDLSARREDIPLLIRHFASKLASEQPSLGSPPSSASAEEPKLSCELVAECLQRQYTTNIRELEAILWNAVGEGSAKGMRSAHKGRVTPDVPSEAPNADAPVLEKGREAVASDGEAVRGYVDPRKLQAADIQAMLDRHNGHIETAWRALGLKSRFALTRLIAKHGIEVRRKSRSKPSRR